MTTLEEMEKEQLRNMLSEIAEVTDANDLQALLGKIEGANRQLLELKCSKELAIELNSIFGSVTQVGICLASHRTKLHDFVNKLETTEEAIN